MNEKYKNSGRLPNFMVIGAAKSGTSTLFHNLFKHPQIFIPTIKEPEYFSRQSVYERGLKWYISLFSSAQDGQLCGDASTTYTRWPHTIDAPKLIAEILPDIKFIYIMRNPVDRAYSHYGHHMRSGVTMTFEEALQKDNIYLNCSRYMVQIERYLRFFEPEQFLFLFLEDLKQNTAKLFTSIFKFLGVEPVDMDDDGINKRNAGGADHYIRYRTTKRLRKIYSVEFLADFLPKRIKDEIFNLIRTSYFGQRFAKEAELKPMLPETRQHLIEYFESDNRALEEFLELKLDTWRK